MERCEHYNKMSDKALRDVRIELLDMQMKIIVFLAHNRLMKEYNKLFPEAELILEKHKLFSDCCCRSEYVYLKKLFIRLSCKENIAYSERK